MAEKGDPDRLASIQPRVFFGENHARFEVDDPMGGTRWLDLQRRPNGALWAVQTNIPGIGNEIRGNRSEALVFFSAALGNEITRVVMLA